MVSATWKEIPGPYPGVDFDEWVVMPNHLHGIVVLDGNEEGLGRVCQTGTRFSLADVVQRFKGLTTSRYMIGVRESGWPPFAGRLWQRNYYEHVIRDEEELNRIRTYIRDNPAGWTNDPENPAALAGRGRA